MNNGDHSRWPREESSVKLTFSTRATKKEASKKKGAFARPVVVDVDVVVVVVGS